MDEVKETKKESSDSVFLFSSNSFSSSYYRIIATNKYKVKNEDNKNSKDNKIELIKTINSLSIIQNLSVEERDDEDGVFVCFNYSIYGDSGFSTGILNNFDFLKPSLPNSLMEKFQKMREIFYQSITDYASEWAEMKALNNSQRKDYKLFRFQIGDFSTFIIKVNRIGTIHLLIPTNYWKDEKGQFSVSLDYFSYLLFIFKLIPEINYIRQESPVTDVGKKVIVIN